MGKDMLSGVLFVVALVGSVVASGAKGGRTDEPPAVPAGVSFSAPGSSWAVTQHGRGFEVWSLVRVEPPGFDRLRPGAQATAGRQELHRASILPALFEGPRLPTWLRLTEVPALLTVYRGAIAALRPSGQDATLIAVGIHGGGSRMLRAALLEADAEGRGVTEAGAQPSGELYTGVEWQLVRKIDCTGAAEDSSLRDLTYPSLTQFGEDVFVGGQSFYPGTTAERAVWVAKVRPPEQIASQNALNGALIGEGRAPTFMAFEERLWSLAIRKVKPGTMLEDELEGRVVGWTSDDGADWKEWDPGIPMQDVVSVDACADAERGFVACISGLPAPVIRLYELDQDSGSPLGVKLREVHSFQVPEPEGVDRRVVVRLLDSTPYVFWSRTEDDTTTIHMRRIDLAGAARAQAEPAEPDTPGNER
jgi:hypothetical protein